MLLDTSKPAFDIGKKKHSLGLDELRQPVNQWLLLAFICLFIYWLVLYVLAHKVQTIGNEDQNTKATVNALKQ